MNNNKYTCLPKELLSVGQSLESMGISEIAWKSQDALRVIDYLTKIGYVILGGDVYTYNDNEIESTYDSWYSNKSISESIVQESKKKAFEYITEYNKNNGDNYLYSIIFEVE
ncbi:MAG: Imm40 family immunity protein [Bacillota bacterium]